MITAPDSNALRLDSETVMTLIMRAALLRCDAGFIVIGTHRHPA